MLRKSIAPLILATFACFVLAATGPTWAKNPHQPPPPPSQSPVNYQIRLFTVPVPGADISGVHDMNNWGQVVGYYCTADGETRPFLFDPATDNTDDAIGVAHDLNDIVDPETLPVDWVIGGAYMGINDRGDIAGYVLFDDGSGNGVRRHLCIIKTNDESGTPLEWPPLYLIPDGLIPHEYVATWANAINENGDVLGAYRDLDGGTHNFVCNPGWYTGGGGWYNVPILELPGSAIPAISEVQVDAQGTVPPMIVGEDSLGLGAFRATLGTDDLEYFPWGPAGSFAQNITGGTVLIMNAKGTFCGESWVVDTDGKTVYAPYLIRADGSYRQLAAGASKTRYTQTHPPLAINSNEDVIVNNWFPPTLGYSLSLHHADLHEGYDALELNDLVVETRSAVIGSYSDLEIWFDSNRRVADMNDRLEVTDPSDISAINFGQIAGWISPKAESTIYEHPLGFVLTPVEPTP